MTEKITETCRVSIAPVWLIIITSITFDNNSSYNSIAISIHANIKLKTSLLFSTTQQKDDIIYYNPKPIKATHSYRHIS